MSEFANEPILELRRAPHREALLEGMRAFTQQAIFRVPVWIGDGERHGEEIVSTDPGDPERVIATAASASADAKLPLEVPMLIGEDVVHGRRFASVDPSQPTRIVAHAHEATAAHVADAVERAQKGHAIWSRKPAAERPNHYRQYLPE